MNISKVVINLSLDREFDYLVPSHLADKVRVGSRVRVPFGKGNSSRIGYVVGFESHSSFSGLKELTEVIGDRAQIPDKLVDLAQWMAEYYCCAKEQAVRLENPVEIVANHPGLHPHRSFLLIHLKYPCEVL